MKINKQEVEEVKAGDVKITPKEALRLVQEKVRGLESDYEITFGIPEIKNSFIYPDGKETPGEYQVPVNFKDKKDGTEVKANEYSWGWVNSQDGSFRQTPSYTFTIDGLRRHMDLNRIHYFVIAVRDKPSAEQLEKVLQENEKVIGFRYADHRKAGGSLQHYIWGTWAKVWKGETK